MVATPHGARFFVVTDRVPAATTTLLRDACVHRGVDYLDVNARNFEPSSIPLPALGDLLYRAATSPMAHLVEQYLSVAGVASFQTPAAARAAGTWQELTLARAGVPVAQSAPLSSTNRGLRKRVVESLGGLPVVVKVPGGEGGVGIMLADTWPALHSLLDHLAASGQLVHLQRFVVDAVHWRCIVVGTEVVAAYPNDPIPEDFRTSAPTDPGAFVPAAPPRVSRAALAAAAALGTEFAGVDVLVDAQGEALVLESNTPCFFAPAQEVGAIDVAGAMVDHLQRKAQGVSGPTPGTV